MLSGSTRKMGHVPRASTFDTEEERILVKDYFYPGVGVEPFTGISGKANLANCLNTAEVAG